MNIWVLIFAAASIVVPYLIVRRLSDGPRWCLRSFKHDPDGEKWGCIGTVGFLGIALGCPYLLRELLDLDKGTSVVISFSLSVIFFYGILIDWKRLKKKQ